jgi:hypothetical protein
MFIILLMSIMVFTCSYNKQPNKSESKLLALVRIEDIAPGDIGEKREKISESPFHLRGNMIE